MVLQGSLSMELAGTKPDLDEIQHGSPVRPLIGFLAPRHWAAWLLVSWFKFSSCLPWRFAIWLHKLMGRVLWLFMSRHGRIIGKNLRLCFPGLEKRQLRKLVRLHFESLSVCIAETAFAWFGKVSDSLAPFHIEGDEHVYAALAKGNGVILYTGHFTPVEICAPILKQRFPLFSFMFHRRRNALLDEIQRRGRDYSGHFSFPSNNVRAMLRALKRNAVVWYAPDQHFPSRSTAVLPFFDRPATVSTAPWRLARTSGAAIVPFSYWRLPDGRGYVLRFDPPLENLDSCDELAGTRRLLDVLENAIRRCPEQYCWTRRFLKGRLATAPARVV